MNEPQPKEQNNETRLPEPTLAQTEAEGEGRIGYGRYARYSPLGLAALIAIVVAAVWLWPQGDPDATDLSPGGFAGRPAPEITLTTFSGNTVDLSSLRGSVVVVNFWAEWCAPCRIEMPAFQEIFEQTMLTGSRWFFSA